MAIPRFIFTLCALIPLTGCAVYTAHEQLDALNQSVPSGSAFDQRLAVEYRDMANQDNDHFLDYEDAAHFSRKGLKAAAGETVLPEDPDDWWISDNDKDGMTQGRQTLLAVLDGGGRDRAPTFSAVAQARFDCWVERSDRTECRAGFKQALDQARAQMDKREPAPEVIPQTDREAEIRAAKFLVFFDWNKATVTNAAEKVIDTAISEAQRLGVHQIDVIGNADKSGTERYNQKLSLARALAVKKRLIERGIGPAQITAIAHGDDHPLVPTGRGVREPANRRVEIHFE
jgi:OOP family OmpA-OmpF porin